MPMTASLNCAFTGPALCGFPLKSSWAEVQCTCYKYGNSFETLLSKEDSFNSELRSLFSSNWWLPVTNKQILTKKNLVCMIVRKKAVSSYSCTFIEINTKRKKSFCFNPRRFHLSHGRGFCKARTDHSKSIEKRWISKKVLRPFK